MQVWFPLVKRCTRYLIFSFCHSIIAEDKKTFGTTHIFWWVIDILINDWSRTEKGDGCAVVSELMTLVSMYTRTFSWVSRMYRVLRQKNGFIYIQCRVKNPILLCSVHAYFRKIFDSLLYLSIYTGQWYTYTLNQNFSMFVLLLYIFIFPAKILAPTLNW